MSHFLERSLSEKPQTHLDNLRPVFGCGGLWHLEAHSSYSTCPNCSTDEWQFREDFIQQTLYADSLVFWEKPLDDSQKPFSCKLRSDVLVQLRNQLGIDPKQWRFRSESGEGSVHYSEVYPRDKVENTSGIIVNFRTREERSFWYDWESDCKRLNETSDCRSKTPKDCNFRGYVDLLDNQWFDSETNRIER